MKTFSLDSIEQNIIYDCLVNELDKEENHEEPDESYMKHLNHLINLFFTE